MGRHAKQPTHSLSTVWGLVARRVAFSIFAFKANCVLPV